MDECAGCHEADDGFGRAGRGAVQRAGEPARAALDGAGARVGTVVRFQGQEAPVVIYSLATSRPEGAPRGMEFLYSANRRNVATSRARCAVFLVASRRLFEPECQSPRRMMLAHALCRYREVGGGCDCEVTTSSRSGSV